MKLPTLIAVLGPTAIGKTKWAIRIARHFKTEILSADSRQFYREMHIGTAVPNTSELKAVTHHFIQHLSVDIPYSVAAFEKDALQLLRSLFLKHQIVVMTGGSGLYLDAVIKGLDSFPEVGEDSKQQVAELYKKEGLRGLQRALQEHDPDHFKRVDKENPRRLIRALEVCYGSGRPYSDFLGKSARKRPFHVVKLGLNADREYLYNRINLRVDQMINEGLVEEARALYGKRDLQALQTVGYSELFRHFEGEYPLEEAVEEIKKNTRRYAKRQLTWFRKDPEILWVDHDAPEKEVLGMLEKAIEGKDRDG